MAKAESEVKSKTLDAEMAKWLEDIRHYGKLGGLGVLIGWIFSQAPGGRVGSKSLNILNLLRKRGGMELKQFVAWTKSEWEESLYAAISGIAMLAVSGLTCIMAGAFITGVMWKAIIIDLMIVFAFYLVHDFWARRILPLAAIGLAKNFIDQATFDKMTSFVKFLIHSPSTGLTQGLEWVGTLRRYCGMVVFWYIVGSQYIIWVPLAQVRPLMFAIVPSIPVFFLATTVWAPKVRGMEISWVIWAELAMLVDVMFLAVFHKELYQPLVNGDTLAKAIMMTIVMAEAIGVVYLVIRIRRPKAADRAVSGTSGSGYIQPSDRIKQHNRYPDSWQGIQTGIGKWVIWGGLIYLIIIGINNFAPWLWTVNTAIHP